MDVEILEKKVRKYVEKVEADKDPMSEKMQDRYYAIKELIAGLEHWIPEKAVKERAKFNKLKNEFNAICNTIETPDDINDAAWDDMYPNHEDGEEIDLW